jgi:hypothetical protein
LKYFIILNIFVSTFLFPLDILEVDFNKYPDAILVGPRFLADGNLLFNRLDSDYNFKLINYDYKTNDIVTEKEFNNYVSMTYFIINKTVCFYDYHQKTIYILDIDNFTITKKKKICFQNILFSFSTNFIGSGIVLTDRNKYYIETLKVINGKLVCKKLFLENFPIGIFEDTTSERFKYILYGSNDNCLWILSRQKEYYEIGVYNIQSNTYIKKIEFSYRESIENFTSARDFFNRIIITDSKLLLFGRKDVTIFLIEENFDSYSIPFIENDGLYIYDYDSVDNRIVLRLNSNGIDHTLIISNLNN